MNRKQVNYRIGTGPCLVGYLDLEDCVNSTVYTDLTGTTVVAGAVITPAGNCPAEVVVVATVPPPVVTPAITYDREVGSWCDPTTGAPVAVVTTWDEAAPPAGAPAVAAYNLDGSVYAGSISALVKCAADGMPDIETLDQVVCDGTASFTHTAFIDTATLATVGSLWRDASGAVIAAPAGPFTLGPCVAAADPFTGLTDAELRAAAVAVVGPLTAAELDAMVVDVNVTNPGPTAAEIASAVDAALRATSLPVTQTTPTGHHESVVLCDPANAGAPVIYTTWWLDTSANTAVPYITVTNRDGTSWAGTVSTLVDCSRITSSVLATIPGPSYVGESTVITQSVLVSAALSQAVHAPITRPVYVKLVNEPREREVVSLCNPATGAPVLVHSVWRDASLFTDPPSVFAVNLDGTAYAGDIAQLVDCSQVAEPVAVVPQFTPSVLTATAAGTVAAGAYSFSIFNRGTANAIVDGDALIPNMGVNFEAPDGATLAAMTYDGSGTTLIITQVR